MSYLAKDYVVSCRNHVLLKFHRRWYGLVRRMLEDSVPVFDVHKDPKPGKVAKKALREVASKLVRIVAQAVAKEWHGPQILFDKLTEAMNGLNGLAPAIASAPYLEGAVRHLVEWTKSQYLRYKDVLPALHQKENTNWCTLLPWHYDMLVSAREAKLRDVRAKQFTLLPLASLSSPPHITIDTKVLHQMLKKVQFPGVPTE